MFQCACMEIEEELEEAEELSFIISIIQMLQNKTTEKLGAI